MGAVYALRFRSAESDRWMPVRRYRSIEHDVFNWRPLSMIPPGTCVSLNVTVTHVSIPCLQSHAREDSVAMCGRNAVQNSESQGLTHISPGAPLERNISFLHSHYEVSLREYSRPTHRLTMCIPLIRWLCAAPGYSHLQVPALHATRSVRGPSALGQHSAGR